MLRKLSSNTISLTIILALMALGGCGGGSDSGAAQQPAPGSGSSSPSDSSDPNLLAPLAMPEFDPNWGVEGVFSSATSCGNCHSASTDTQGILRFPKQADGEDISPYAGWRHSVMAHSFNDPYYQAVVQDEVKHFPALAGTIEDKCLTCHTPMAHNHAHLTGGALDANACLSADGCYRMTEAETNMVAREGVSCTLCHQVDTRLPNSTFSGGFVVDPNALTIYGPYSNPITNPMRNNTQYTVEGLAAIQNSEQCAVCHNLKTPSVDVNTGQLTGNEFTEQSAYTEWLNSDFNTGGGNDKQCQDCHMPRINGYQSQIARTPNGNANTNWPLRDEYSQHQFLGGNNYLLTLLKEFAVELGISNTTTLEGFNQQIANNTDFLTERTASVAIANIALLNNTLQVDVDVTNHSGHKLPTSYPSRRVWLNLIIKNSSGDILFESGTPTADGFLSVDTNQTAEKCTAVVKTISYVEEECLSKHKDIITTADEIAIYETVMGDTNNQVTYVLLHGHRYLKDNRIPPVGFSQTDPRFSPDVAVIGDAASDPDFNRDGGGSEGTGVDRVHYQLDWAAKPANNLVVEATLYYQTIKPAFVTGIHNSGDKIDRFKWMYNQKKPQPVSLASDQQSY